MKKILLSFLAIVAVTTSAFAFGKKVDTELVVMPLFSTEASAPNKVWVGTFELVWNELVDEVVKAPIEFTDGLSYLAEQFNKKEFTKDMLNENSYYTAHGVANMNLKKQIDAALKNKFNETSDILNGMDWSGRNYLVYAMLKKDFEFLSAFDELKKEKFGKNRTKVKYFGINEKSSKDLRDNVKVLFYNNENDFAVELRTKQNDRVQLYRTDDERAFSLIYDDMLKKSAAYTEDKNFIEGDKLKVPFISFKSRNDYPEIEGKTIKGTDLTIDKAIQSIDFKIDNKGVKLKSEAALMMKMSLLHPSFRKPANFYFDDTFVMFLIEKDKPYFALRVVDVDALNKKK